jgi:hypothetical protein
MNTWSFSLKLHQRKLDTGRLKLKRCCLPKVFDDNEWVVMDRTRGRRPEAKDPAEAGTHAHEIRARIVAAQRPSLLKNMLRCYNAANEVVCVPFLAVVCLAIAAFYHVNRPPSGRARFLAESYGTGQWMWGYGEGSDVVGRVNCTTYVHMSLGTVVELGHGSGGGISFRATEDSEVRWAWEDGSMEIQDNGLACAALAAKILAHGGNVGVPTYRLFNRYNTEFWIADRSQQGGDITYRNALNPVVLTLHRRGFTFVSKDGASNITVVDGEPIYHGHAANHTAANASTTDFTRFVRHGPPAPPPPRARRTGVVVEKVNGRTMEGVSASAQGTEARGDASNEL